MIDYGFTPNPGEVWVVTERKAGDLMIHMQTARPFIITYISLSHIGYVAPGLGPEPDQSRFRRGDFPWLEHCTRVFPPIPAWSEILENDLKKALDKSQAEIQAAIGFLKLYTSDQGPYFDTRYSSDIIDRMYTSLGLQHRLLKKMGIDMNLAPDRPEAYHKAYGGNDASH